MAYTRVSHASNFSDGSATDAAVVVNAIEVGLENAESTIASHTTSLASHTSTLATHTSQITALQSATTGTTVGVPTNAIWVYATNTDPALSGTYMWLDTSVSPPNFYYVTSSSGVTTYTATPLTVTAIGSVVATPSTPHTGSSTLTGAGVVNAPTSGYTVSGSWRTSTPAGAGVTFATSTVKIVSSGNTAVGAGSIDQAVGTSQSPVLTPAILAMGGGVFDSNNGSYSSAVMAKSTNGSTFTLSYPSSVLLPNATSYAAINAFTQQGSLSGKTLASGPAGVYVMAEASGYLAYTVNSGTTWSNGQQIAGTPYAVYYTGTTWLIGCNINRIYTSTDHGVTTTLRTTATTGLTIRGFAYGVGSAAAGQGRSVGVGSNDLTSAGISWYSNSQDGTAAWTTVTGVTAASRPLVAVAFGNGTFVAVGGATTNAAVSTSTDGVSWTTQTNTIGRVLTDVAYGASTFVAVGANGMITTAADTAVGTWTTRTSGTTDGFNSVIYSGSSFYACTSNDVYSSTNGVTWTKITLTAGGLIAIASAPQAATTTSSVATTGISSYVVVTTGNTERVTASSPYTSFSGSLLTSTTAGGWGFAGVGDVTVLMDGTALGKGIAYDANAIVWVTTINGGSSWSDTSFALNPPSTSIALQTSLLGTTGLSSSVSTFSFGNRKVINNNYVFPGTSATVYSTTTGTLTTANTYTHGITSYAQYDIAYGLPSGSTTPVYVSTGSTSAVFNAAYSGNFNTGWLTASVTNGGGGTSTTSGRGYSVAYGNGYFVSVGGQANSAIAGPHIWNSSTGTTWTQLTVAGGGLPSGLSTQTLLCSAYGASKFVAAGTGGMILSSNATGTTWTAATSGVTVPIFRLTYWNNAFWALTTDGRLLTSSTGTGTWTVINPTHADTAHSSNFTMFELATY